MCSLHFKESDYQIERKDSNLTRKYHLSDQVQRKQLRTDAVPSVFQNLPEYYNKTITEQRSESTSFQHRFQTEFDANELAVENFLAADQVASLQELEEKISQDLPKHIFP